MLASNSAKWMSGGLMDDPRHRPLVEHGVGVVVARQPARRARQRPGVDDGQRDEEREGEQAGCQARARQIVRGGLTLVFGGAPRPVPEYPDETAADERASKRQRKPDPSEPSLHEQHALAERPRRQSPEGHRTERPGVEAPRPIDGMDAAGRRVLEHDRMRAALQMDSAGVDDGPPVEEQSRSVSRREAEGVVSGAADEQAARPLDAESPRRPVPPAPGDLSGGNAWLELDADRGSGPGRRREILRAKAGRRQRDAERGDERPEREEQRRGSDEKPVGRSRHGSGCRYLRVSSASSRKHRRPVPVRPETSRRVRGCVARLSLELSAQLVGVRVQHHKAIRLPRQGIAALDGRSGAFEQLVERGRQPRVLRPIPVHGAGDIDQISNTMVIQAAHAFVARRSYDHEPRNDRAAHGRDGEAENDVPAREPH